jgi:hypothetical protein
MPRLFALDKNFPQPIVGVLSDFQADAQLVPLDRSMLAQGRELATLIQTKLTLVVAVASGHNPVKASGLLFAYLAGICQRTTPERAQVWRLNAVNRAHEEPWELLKRFADHNGRSAEEVWAELKLSAAAMA